MLELLLTKGFPVAVAKDHPDNEYPNQDERCAKYGWDETIRHRIAPVEIAYALHVRSAGNPCLSRAKSLSGPVRHDLLRRSGAIVHSTSIRIDGLGPLCESQGLLPYQPSLTARTGVAGQAPISSQIGKSIGITPVRAVGTCRHRFPAWSQHRRKKPAN